MSNIITKAHPVPDMHSTGLRVVGAWLFAIVLILFSTVFVHVPYTREIIIRKSKFPQNPKRSVRFSGKRTKRSVQKRKARNTQKAETKVL